MAENGGATPEDQEIKPSRKAVRTEMFKKMDKKVEGGLGSFSLDSDHRQKSDRHLQVYAKKLDRDAAVKQEKLNELPEDDDQRSELEEEVESLGERATKVAAVVASDKTGVEQAKDRVRLLSEYRDELVNGLPEGMDDLFRKSRDRNLKPRERSEARRKLKEKFNKIKDPQERDSIERNLNTIAHVSRLGFEIDGDISEAEDLDGKTIRERFKSFWRGEMNVGKLRTHFARWFSKKTGFLYEVHRDPNAMSTATRELLEAEGVDGFELLSSSVEEDIDEVEKAELKRLEKENKKVEKETPEEEQERTGREQEELSDDEIAAQERAERFSKIRDDIESGKITLKDGLKMMEEEIEVPEKSVDELNKELNEKIEDAAADKKSEWTTENVDSTKAKEIIKSLAEGTSLKDIAYELYPKGVKNGQKNRHAFLEHFKKGMKVLGLTTEEDLKQLKTGDIGNLEQVFRNAVGSAIDAEEREKDVGEYKKYRRRLFWYYLLEGMWDQIKSGVMEGTAGATTGGAR